MIDISKIQRVITHDNCPDGMASAILLKGAFPHVEPEFYHHSQKGYLNLVATPGMLFCDIVPPPKRANEFVRAGAVVLDHHKKAQGIVEMFGNNGVFADEKEEPGVSGASLAFREVLKPLLDSQIKQSKGEEKRRLLFILEKAEDFARLAGIRDTWQKDNPDFRKASEQAAMLTFFPWDYWVKRDYLDFDFAGEMDVGKSLLEKRMREATKCANDSLIFETKGYRVAVFNDPDKLCSDVSEIHRNNGIDVVAGFYYFKDQGQLNITYSLRSNDKFDVGQVANQLGGGGHSKAAGFSMPVFLEDENPFLGFYQIFEKYVG